MLMASALALLSSNALAGYKGCYGKVSTGPKWSTITVAGISGEEPYFVGS
jgi:hypothetical protein